MIVGRIDGRENGAMSKEPKDSGADPWPDVSRHGFLTGTASGAVVGGSPVVELWHPQELADGHANVRRLFSNFVEAARGSRRR